jgi:putative membrane protein insertion efficiency factor
MIERTGLSDSFSSQPSLAVRVAYRCYKSVLSPVLHAFSPAQCLYLPTCSEYAYVALVRFGVVRGTWLAVRRFARCHPFAKGGLDPVPPRNSGFAITSGFDTARDKDHLA